MEFFTFSRAYPWKVWLTSIIVTPVFYVPVVVYSYEDLQMPDVFFVYAIMLFYGLFWSLPAFLAFAVGFHVLILKKASQLQMKMALSGLVFLSIIITFYSFPERIDLIIFYSIIAVISCFFYNAEK